MPVSILSVSLNLPRPDRAAGDLRYFRLLALLARRHRVDLFAYHDRTADAEYVRGLEQVGVNVLPSDGYGGLRTVVRSRRYDIGWFEFWTSAASTGDIFRQHQPWAKFVVDSVDMHFAREAGALAVGDADAESVARNRGRELAVYNGSDAVVVITDHDRDTLRGAGYSGPTYTIPLIIPSRPRPDLSRRPEVLFVGGFNHRPNADGLLWFARNMWGGVRAAVPTAELTVAGSDPPPEVTELDGKDGIRVLGYVPETGPYLDRAAVAIAPLRYGAGMKGKVAEALLSGVPVVTTSIGAQGFGIVSGEHALVADTPADFAASVQRVLTDNAFAGRLGAAGRSLVAALCTPEAVGGALDGVIADLTRAVRRPPPRLRWLARAAYLRVRSVVHRL